MQNKANKAVNQRTEESAQKRTRQTISVRRDESWFLEF